MLVVASSPHGQYQLILVDLQHLLLVAAWQPAGDRLFERELVPDIFQARVDATRTGVDLPQDGTLFHDREHDPRRRGLDERFAFDALHGRGGERFPARPQGPDMEVTPGAALLSDVGRAVSHRLAGPHPSAHTWLDEDKTMLGQHP